MKTQVMAIGPSLHRYNVHLDNANVETTDSLKIEVAGWWLGRWTCNPEVPSSNSAPCHWMDLSSVVPNSTPPRFVNSQLVSLPPVGILNKNFCFFCI